MLLLGILLGLGAAILQSLSYLFSRDYVVRRDRAAMRLLVISHVLMGVVSLVLLPFVYPHDAPPLRTYFWEVVGVAGFYLLGQAGLFLVLQRTDASRISPLLGLKVLILAAISAAFLAKDILPLQWAAVGLSVLAAMVLASAGGRLSAKALAGVLGVCLFYSLSDLSIQAAVNAMAPVGRLHASVAVLSMSYIACGVFGLPLLPWTGVGTRRDWRHAVPFAATWYGAMACLFACFAVIGVIPGNILQSLRGPISVFLGAAVAHLGHAHLEARISRWTLLRRGLAALLMVAAVALYLSQR